MNTPDATTVTTKPIAAPVSPLAAENSVLRPLAIDSVRLTDGFWADWQRTNRDITIPHAFHWLEHDGTVDNLRRLDPAAGGTPDRHGLRFTDSDLYKALEGVGWALGREPSAELEALMSEMAAIVGRAQQEDGYVNSFVQAGLDVRWDNLRTSHELYCIGHLIQAAIAHKRATGNDELLEVAIRAADCAVHDFAEGRRGDTDGHEEIEMALVELYRQTGERTYLDLAQQFIDVRGYGVLPADSSSDSVYFQDATPVREETTVVGHAVRAVYLLAGVVDLYLETGEQALLDSAIRQWESMSATKTYLNGALGSRFEGEAFGEEYELPQDLVYGETCATIGNIMLSWRLLLATGESRFADTIERGLYNLFSASTSVERTGFFYSNPAQRRAPHPAAPTDSRPTRNEAPGTRPVWFECACCPPNIVRTVASLSGYVATVADSAIQLHQYMPATIEAEVAGVEVRLRVETDYPDAGAIGVRVEAAPNEIELTIALRRPDWADAATVTVNGESVDATPNARGYLEVTRDWREGDRLELSLPIAPRLTVGHPAADAVRGSVAIERGPVVYAFESHDQPSGVDLNHIELLVDEPIQERVEEVAGQSVTVLRVAGVARDDSAWTGTGWMPYDGQPKTTGNEVELTAIPYSLWANRGPSTMRIFVPVHTATKA